MRWYHKLLTILLGPLAGLPFYHWSHGASHFDLLLSFLLSVGAFWASIATFTARSMPITA